MNIHRELRARYRKEKNKQEKFFNKGWPTVSFNDEYVLWLEKEIKDLKQKLLCMDNFKLQTTAQTLESFAENADPELIAKKEKELNLPAGSIIYCVEYPPESDLKCSYIFNAEINNRLLKTFE